MDKNVFLRDIDDWELYARGLEAHLMMMHESIEAHVRNSVPVVDCHRDSDRIRLISRLRGELSSLLNQAAERSKRLRGDWDPQADWRAST